MGLTIVALTMAADVFALAVPALQVFPPCAKPDSVIVVETNGWPRRYHRNVIYRVFIGDTLRKGVNRDFTSRWIDTLAVPRLAPGDYTLRVEMLERIPSGSGYQGFVAVCTGFTIPVLAASPWSAETTSTNNWRAAQVTVAYDPLVSCEVPHAKRIDLLQVLRVTGTDSSGSVRPLAAAEQAYPGTIAAHFDSATTIGGFRVDAPVEANLPYYTDYGIPDPAVAQPGDSVRRASLTDAPRRPAVSYPPGIVKITIDFEVGALCTEGEQAGRWLGEYRWRWEQSKGALATITMLGGSRNQPSATFFAAEALWQQLHPKYRPMLPGPAITGGYQCFP